MTTSSTPFDSLTPGEGDNSPARLLAHALTQKARAEEDRMKADARAAAAEANAAEMKRQLEDARRNSSVPGDAGARALRNLKEELEAARLGEEENLKELAAARVQLRAKDERLGELEDASAQAAREGASYAEALATERRAQQANLTQLQSFSSELDRVRNQLAMAVDEKNALQVQWEALNARAEIAKLDAMRSRSEADRAGAEVARASQATQFLTQAQAALAQEKQAHEATRNALDMEKQSVAVQTAALMTEKLARETAQQAYTMALNQLETERASNRKENEVLGAALMGAEQTSARAREELGRVNARLAELEHGASAAGNSKDAEVTRLQGELAGAEADRKEAMERARKAERERLLAQKEVEAVNAEVKALRQSNPPGGKR